MPRHQQAGSLRHNRRLRLGDGGSEDRAGREGYVETVLPGCYPKLVRVHAVGMVEGRAAGLRTAGLCAEDAGRTCGCWDDLTAREEELRVTGSAMSFTLHSCKGLCERGVPRVRVRLAASLRCRDDRDGSPPRGRAGAGNSWLSEQPYPLWADKTV